MVGCEHDIKGHPEPERLVTVSLTVGSQPVSLLKASTEENVIKVVLFGVDASDNYVDKYTIDGSNQSLLISNRIKVLYAVANPPDEIADANPSKTDLQNMIAGFTGGKPQLPFLMSGIGVISNSSVSIDLVRAVAKIEINGKKKFKVTEVTVTNTPDKGYVFPESTLVIPSGRDTYTSTDTILYVAENISGAGTTRFTVTGTYEGKTATYNFVLDNDLDIVRNKHYCVGISPYSSSSCTFTIDIPEWVDAPATNDQVIVKPNPYKNGIKILAIGNSYSQNAMQYMYDMLRHVGVTGDIVLMNALINGGDLEDHANNIRVDDYSDLYRQTFHTEGAINTSAAGAYTLRQMIRSENWDVITLQQASAVSGVPETYNNDLDFLINYIHDNAREPKNYKLGWHMTWAYAASYFPLYTWAITRYGNQQGMYEMTCTTVQEQILLHRGASFDFVIPVGTAIQNARKPSSLGFGDYLNYDGTHLDNRGCYIAAATWIKTITGYDIARLETPYPMWPGTVSISIVRAGEAVPYWMPSTPASFEIIQKAVNAAATTPFATTPYTNLDP